MLLVSRPLQLAYGGAFTLRLLASQAKALSSQQLASVFGQGAKNLTGSSSKTGTFVTTIVTNATHALYSFNSTSQPSRVGWMGVGSGTEMANADYIIAWPNEGSAATPWTISHRSSPGGEDQPVVAASAPATSTSTFYTFLPELSTDASASYTAVSFLRLLEPPSSYPSKSSYKSLNRNGRNCFIYASSTVSPRSSDEGADLAQHNQAHSTTSLDLSKPVSLGSNGTAGGASGDAGLASGGIDSTASGLSTRDIYLIAHAVCASLALVVFTPIAVLLALFFRGYTWYPSHAALNSLTGAFVVVAVALGFHSVLGKHFEGTHQRLGLLVLLLLAAQLVVGVIAHSRPVHLSPASRLPTLAKKSPFRLLHIVLGIGILGLAWLTVNEGFETWETSSDAQAPVPMGLKIIFYGLIVLYSAGYVAGWVIEAMGGNRPRKMADDGELEAEKIALTSM